MSPFDVILWLIAGVLFLLLFAIPWINGVLDIVMGYRFQRNAIAQGAKADRTAFFLNWNAFKWGWLHNAGRIVEAMPFFKQDLSETFGIRPDDGRVT